MNEPENYGLTGITTGGEAPASDAQGQLDQMLIEVKTNPNHPFNITTNPKAHREAYERMYALRLAAAGETGPTTEQRKEQEASPDVVAARAKLSELKAQIYEDPKHAFLDAHHPDHRKVVQEMMALNKQAITGTMQDMTPQEKVMHEALEEKAQEQTKRNIEAEKLINTMKADGFELPEGYKAEDDIPQWQIEIWQMQHLNKKNNFEALTPIMGKHLKDLGATQASQSAFDTFLNLPDMNPATKSDIAHRILADIAVAHKTREKEYK